MDRDATRFGRGPKELGGAVDLINQFKLWPHHDFFCKKPLPLSISETQYLHNVVGDTEIRKGDGMKLDQLLENSLYVRKRNANIHPFDLGMLGEAFRIRETTPVRLPAAEKGIHTSVLNSKGELEDKGRKHKKYKDKNHHNDNTPDKHKNVPNGLKSVQLKEQPDMKRRLDCSEDLSVRELKRVRFQR